MPDMRKMNEAQLPVTAVILAVGVALAGITGASGTETNASPDARKAAPVNTWVKVCESKTGGRELPLFVYVPWRVR